MEKNKNDFFGMLFFVVLIGLRALIRWSDSGNARKRERQYEKAVAGSDVDIVDGFNKLR